MHTPQLILRRYIWRGGEDKPHFLNLHHLYEHDKLLVSSISNAKIASLLQLKDLTRVSKQLTKLEKYGVVKRIRTGRQNIYVLGEWYDYSEGKDGSKRLVQPGGKKNPFGLRPYWDNMTPYAQTMLSTE